MHAALVNSLRPSHYKLLTWVVAVGVGIFAADYFFPNAGSVTNALAAGAIAAVVAVVMVWLGGRRQE